MQTLGTQHIAELQGCDEKLLNDAAAMEKLVFDGIRFSGLSLVKIVSHKFEPIGVTVLAILSESHVGVHTFPESKHVSLDVFTCSNPEKNMKFIKYIQNSLSSNQLSFLKVCRGQMLKNELGLQPVETNPIFDIKN